MKKITVVQQPANLSDEEKAQIQNIINQITQDTIHISEYLNKTYNGEPHPTIQVLINAVAHFVFILPCECGGEKKEDAKPCYTCVGRYAEELKLQIIKIAKLAIEGPESLKPAN